MSAPRNKFEQSGFDQLKKAKVPFEYEPKDKHVPYTIEAKWVPDFVLNGRIFIEYKGWFRPEHKRKLSSVKRCHPTLDIRIVFQSATEANIRWAERRGIPWAEKAIPKAWIREALKKK